MLPPLTDPKKREGEEEAKTRLKAEGEEADTRSRGGLDQAESI